jgi:hypothetical protein
MRAVVMGVYSADADDAGKPNAAGRQPRNHLA